jgi:very-short-patch-repair endonuclease
MTPSEQRLWKALRKLEGHIRRHAPIGRYVVDFACHARKLATEVDGGVHERLDEVALRDHERSGWLRSQGYTVIRFTNREVDSNVVAVIETIKKHLALPLDGEGLGWGEPAVATPGPKRAHAPRRATCSDALPAPRSPTLSPSRGRGV